MEQLASDSYEQPFMRYPTNLDSDFECLIMPDESSNDEADSVVEQTKEEFEREINEAIPPSIDSSRIHGYNEHIEKFCENFRCIFCYQLPLKAKQCIGCETIACESCLKAWKGSSQCPSKCNNQEFRKLEGRALYLLSLLKFTCENKDYGCNAIIAYSDVQTHSRRCIHNFEKCEHCNRDILRENIDFHLEECPEVPVVCTNGCTPIPFTREEMKTHAFECLQKRIPCNFCHKHIRRANMLQHMKKECANRALRCHRCNLQYTNKKDHSISQCVKTEIRNLRLSINKIQEKQREIYSQVTKNQTSYSQLFLESKEIFNQLQYATNKLKILQSKWVQLREARDRKNKQTHE